jgi:hypothetical protein
MEKKNYTGWWLLAAAAVGTGLYLYWNKKKPAAKPAVKPKAAPPPGSADPAPDTNVNLNQSPAAGSGSTGSNLYSLPGLVVRSSPKIDNGWGGTGFLGNNIKTVSTGGQFIGVILSSTFDSNGDADTDGNIYTWYKFLPAEGVGFPGGGEYYAREDYVTVK